MRRNRCWGSPVVEQNKVQIDAVVGIWRPGESLETVADEYDLTRDQVEAICQHAPAVSGAAASDSLAVGGSPGVFEELAQRGTIRTPAEVGTDLGGVGEADRDLR
jgi:uncharacterized protein (DUF433 family)